MNDDREELHRRHTLAVKKLMMKKPDLKIIHGRREALELKLLRAIFTPGASKTVEMLSKQLARKGQGRLQAVKVSHSREPKDE